MTITVLVGVALLGLRSPASAAEPSHWAVDPMQPGDNLPPVGRSLFDFLVTKRDGPTIRYNVPFPFNALLATIDARFEHPAGGPSPLKRVLIPLGRSLQRLAAAPEFFAFPRVVVAVDGEGVAPPGQSGMLLKDRVYLGYQEKGSVVEVISYNEAAARFEFQVVKDYRPGGSPQVFYANRTVCTACHQNQAPIFSRAEWQETNANPAIASLLHGVRREFYAVPIDQGVDIPLAIQNAAERADRFAAVQRLWQQGCGETEDAAVACRAAALIGALQYRLSSGRGFDRRARAYREDFAPVVAHQVDTRWPGGLQIPNPDLPNRNPLQGFVLADAADVGTEMLRAANVAAPFDPLNPRAPLEGWSAEASDRLITGLTEFLTVADVRALDEALASKAHGAARHRYTTPCLFTATCKGSALGRMKVLCEGERVQIDGRLYFDDDAVKSGTLTRVTMPEAEEIRDVRVATGAVERRGNESIVRLDLASEDAGLHVRRSDGHAVERIELQWPATLPSSAPGEFSFLGQATVVIVEDFATVPTAVARLVQQARAGSSDALSAQPFRRATVVRSLQAELGMSPRAWCCEDAAGMPPAQMETGNDGVPRPPDFGATAEPALALFYSHCAFCHQGSARLPPNFLTGTAEQVRAKLAHCAERIYARLDMWQLPSAQRPKTPMPPATLQNGVDAPPHPDYLVLRAYAARQLASQGGHVPRAADYPLRNYEDLQPCLPAS